MLYVYHVEVENDRDAVDLSLELTQPEGVDVEVALSYGQGPAYLVILSDRELTAQELALPEFRELVLAQKVDVGQALVGQVVDALVGAGFEKVEADGEPEQGIGDSAGEPGGGEG